MSIKQDGTAPRTATDLERKYGFGRTFAEMYDLISDAQKTADNAINAFEGLDQEEIFNRLTNYGEWQGIYRDPAGNIYINASYIKTGKLAAEFIDVDELVVDIIEFHDVATITTVGDMIQIVVGDLGTDEDGNAITVASKIEMTASSIKTEVIGDLGVDENGNPYTVASKIEQTALGITSEVIGNLGSDENGNPYTVASKIEQTASSIKTEVSGYLGTDKDGNPISVANSISTALGGITLEASSTDGSSKLTIMHNGVAVDTEILNLIVDAANISGNVHLGGLLAVYDGLDSGTIGGYIGYDNGYNSEWGIGMRLFENGIGPQCVCTNEAARISYTVYTGNYLASQTGVICDSSVLTLDAYSSIKIRFGQALTTTYGITELSFYPAASGTCLGTASYPWFDIFTAYGSFSELVARVEALEQK